MRQKFGLIFAFLLPAVFAACDPPPRSSTDSNGRVDQPAANLTVNVNANSPSNRREELRKESEQVKKDLDELQKKLENANAESNKLHEKLHETERRIDETKKKIK